MVTALNVLAECPECGETFSVNFDETINVYNYADMYVDHLRGDFDLKKFIESFGRAEILKAMGEMV